MKPTPLASVTLTLEKPFVIRAVEGAKLKRFDILAYTGGKLRVEGADLPVVVDLQGLRASESIPIIVKHKELTDMTLGQTDSITNDGRCIRMTGDVTGDTPQMREKGLVSKEVERVISMAETGHRWQCSIGAQIHSKRQIRAGDVVEVNGQRLVGPFILATDSELFETSVLPTGADKRTTFTLAASAAGLVRGTAIMSFEDFVASLGVDSTKLSDEHRKAFQATYDQMYPTEVEAGAASCTDPGKNPDGVQAQAKLDIRAQAQEFETDTARLIRERNEAEAANDTRIAEIRAKVKDPTIAGTAIKEGWTVEKAELHYLKAQERSRAPAGHSKSHESTCTRQALEGAMILRAGGRLDHPSYVTERAMSFGVPEWLRAGLNSDQRQKAMEDAYQFRDMSMVDLAREALRLDGKDLPQTRQDVIRAAFSGGSLSAIFTTNVNTKILATYEEAGDTTAGWTQEDEVPDFKLNERPRMTKSGRPKKLPRGGTAEHITADAVGESFKIARYADQFVVDEQDMIDDMFQALKDMPVEMGNGFATLRPDLVYSILLANPTLAATGRALFNSTDGNLKSSSALASDKLSAFIAAIQNFQENARNLNLKVTHLIAPNLLWDTAIQLLQSPTIVLGGTAVSITQKGVKNPVFDMSIQPVFDGRLDNGLTDPDSEVTYAGSSTTWYLACAKAKTITVAYRRGTGKAPSIESFKLDKGQWGIGWAGKMDIGGKAMDWRGLGRADA